MIPGLKNVKEVETAAKVGEQFKGLTEKEKSLFKTAIGKDYCRDCGACLPCPRKLNIPAILRFYDLCRIYDLKEWARKLYSGLEVRADNCDNCGMCEPRCPYELPIKETLAEICKTF